MKLRLIDVMLILSKLIEDVVPELELPPCLLTGNSLGCKQKLKIVPNGDDFRCLLDCASNPVRLKHNIFMKISTKIFELK